jgi:tetratricopeptide (TPR) repeat protein
MDTNDALLYKVNKMRVAWSEFYLSQGMDTNSLKQVYKKTIKPMLHEIENSPNPEVKHYAYAVASKISFQLGRFDEAIKLCKTELTILNNELTSKNVDDVRLGLAIDLLFLKREVEANEVFRRVLWKNVSKDSLALWFWLKGDEMQARRNLEEYFAEECSSDIAREDLGGVIRRNEILPYDAWRDARKKKWFIELVSPNTIDFSTEEYTEKSAQGTQEEIKAYNIENQEKDSPTTVFATNASNVFHKRDCSRLNVSEGLKEFDTPRKAGKAGCLPCNYCKP